MSIRKTPLRQAIIEAKEIENAAINSAKKEIEEAIAPKIDKVVKESLMEMEKEVVSESVSEETKPTIEVVKEGVKVEVEPGADISVVVGKDGGATVTAGEGEVENAEAPKIEDIVANLDIPNTEIINTETPNTDITMDEMNNMEEEIYEVEAGAELADVVDDAPVDATIDATVDATLDVDTNNPFDAINQKLDTILNKVDTPEISDDSAEGEVEIVDDETIEAPAAEAPVEAPAPEEVPEAPAAPVTEMDMEDMGDTEEEVVYEMDDEEEEFVRETDGGLYDEIGEMEEIEIVDEEEELEEDSLMRRNRVSQREKMGKIPLGQHAPHSDHATSLNEEKIKAQQESKTDELNQENESLKKTIKEYKESFVVLRKQINEVQVFNAKLAYANKLFINGGLKNEEKVRIAEEFDKVSTVEAAKKLFNNLLKEVAEVKVTKVAPEEKLKSIKPSVQQAEPSKTLYESDEMRRMKKLAGILKEAK